MRWTALAYRFTAVVLPASFAKQQATHQICNGDMIANYGNQAEEAVVTTREKNETRPYH